MSTQALNRNTHPIPFSLPTPVRMQTLPCILPEPAVALKWLRIWSSLARVVACAAWMVVEGGAMLGGMRFVEKRD